MLRSVVTPWGRLPHTPARAEGTLPPGASIEVRNRFNRDWSRGFVVERVVDDGYVIRRASDAALLPAAFDPRDVRLARRS